MSKKVLITSTSFARMDPAPIHFLEENGWEVFRKKGPFSDEKLAVEASGMDALIVGNDLVGPKTVAGVKSLKTVIEHGTGMDNIDFKATESAGITVLNTPHTNAHAVAEYVYSALLSFGRKIPNAAASLENGEWKGSSFAGLELFGKTLGIVGYGHIGKITGRIGVGFGMKPVYYDVIKAPSTGDVFEAEYTDFAELIRISDIVVLHIPLFPETRNLIGEKELSAMKPSAILINASRGGIVDEAALIRALDEKRIAGAIFDVFCQEPLPEDSPLLGRDDVLCTPHLAGYTIDSLKNTSMTAAKRLIEATTDL